MKRNLFLISAFLLASLVAFAADLTGTWNIQGAVPGAPQQLVFTTVNGRVLNGTIDGSQILGGGYKDTEFWFNASRGGTNRPVTRTRCTITLAPALRGRRTFLWRRGALS
jgi:hypothetical protein